MDSPTSWLTNPGWGELDNADDDDDREKNTIAAMLNQRDAEARAKQSEMMKAYEEKRKKGGKSDD